MWSYIIMSTYMLMGWWWIELVTLEFGHVSLKCVVYRADIFGYLPSCLEATVECRTDCSDSLHPESLLVDVAGGKRYSEKTLIYKFRSESNALLHQTMMMLGWCYTGVHPRWCTLWGERLDISAGHWIGGCQGDWCGLCNPTPFAESMMLGAKQSLLPWYVRNPTNILNVVVAVNGTRSHATWRESQTFQNMASCFYLPILDWNRSPR